MSVRDGETYRIMQSGKSVGGLVIKVDGDEGELELLFVSPHAHSRGIGYAAWLEFYNSHHPDPNDPDMVQDKDEQFPAGMFRFEKVVR